MQRSYRNRDFRENTRQEDVGGAPGVCTAVIGSMTQAMKAQSALAEAAIRATLTKISSSKTHNGCAYGVDFPCTQIRNVQIILGNAGIRVRQYLQG